MIYYLIGIVLGIIITVFINVIFNNNLDDKILYSQKDKYYLDNNDLYLMLKDYNSHTNKMKLLS